MSLRGSKLYLCWSNTRLGLPARQSIGGQCTACLTAMMGPDCLLSLGSFKVRDEVCVNLLNKFSGLRVTLLTPSRLHPTNLLHEVCS